MKIGIKQVIDFLRNNSMAFTGALSYITYGYGLFPGRIYKDSATMFELMSEGRSTDQWNALYFWFLSLTSNRGQYPFIPALICAALLYVSVFLFIESLPILAQSKKRIFTIIVITPFVGVFGFTIGHDLTATSGILLLLRILFTMNNHKLQRREILLAALGVVLASTSNLGCAAVFGFSLVMFYRNRKLIAICSILASAAITLAGPSLLSIERAKIDLSLASLVGDMKCIAQHPAAEISQNEWEALTALGPKARWLEPKSCAVADNAFFALQSASNSKSEVLRTWMSLIKNNPQIMLQSRIQRASNALPPIFFRSPPNMFDTSYANPVGASAANDLQIAPDLFKTSVDLPTNQVGRLPLQKIVETIVLVPTFFLNQRSDLWGWGGFWLTFAAFMLLIRFRKTSSHYLVNLAPLIFVHLALILFSPSPSPRYVFASILVGIIFGLNLAVVGLQWVRAKK